MALAEFLIPRKPPTGPRVARPEDRLSGCLEERTALIHPMTGAPLREYCRSSAAHSTDSTHS